MAFDSPRRRRLQADFEAMKRLRAESSIVDFKVSGDPPERYSVTFSGRGLKREGASVEPETIDLHTIEIRLGADYPRSRPDLQWKTKIYHPNISAAGAVCLGGYGTHWVPSLDLDELVEMLWDMCRWANYDAKSAFNYEAARWSEAQARFRFPLDPRPVRDKVRAGGAKKGARRPADEEILIIDDGPAPAPAPRSKRRAPPDDDVLVIT